MRGLGTCYRQKGTRFWWIQYWYGGKRYRESTGEEKLKAAQDFLRRRHAELNGGALPSPGAATIAHLYEGLDRDYLINRRKSHADVQSRWNKHLSPFFGHLSAVDLDSDQVSIYIAKRQKEGAANGTINRELAALKRMYKLGIKNKKVKAAPHIEMLREGNARKGFVKDAQYSALARTTSEAGVWLRAMFEVAYTYGWRKGELLAMRVRQVDLMERTITLNPGETKNDEGRIVEMTGKVFELIAQCVANKSAEDFVFTRKKDRQGRAIKNDGGRIADFRIDWKEACEKAGCSGLLFHDLRRSGVRNMRRTGISEKVAMTISGHRTRSVFERYNIIDPADMREAIGKMERAARDRRRTEQFQQQLAFEDPDEVTDSGAEGLPRTELPPRKSASSAPPDSHRTVIVAASSKPN